MNRTGNDDYMKRRMNWLGAAVLLLLFLNILLGFFAYRKDTSFKVEDTRFHLVSREEGDRVFKDQDGELLTVSIEEPDKNQVSFATRYTVEYGEKEFRVESDDFFEKGYRISENGEEVYVEAISESQWFESDEGIATRNHGRMEDLPLDVQMIYGLEDAVSSMGDNMVEANVVIVLILLLLSALGVFLILFPELAWKLEHFLWVEGGEPSELYLSVHRMAGGLILFLVMGMHLARVL